VVALILILRADKAKQGVGEVPPGIPSTSPGECREPKPAYAPHELLVAWVQFLKTDIMEAVNTLNNRLNVISHTVSEATSQGLTPETRQAFDRIRNEVERATKISSGLLHRVHALAPDTMPPVLFEYDGSKIPPGRILLVENDEANRSVISKVFERLGQQVTAVSNGFEAFAALEAAEPDCIISDIRLPYLDGRTLFEQVEHQKPHLAARFVFVTGDYTNPATIKFLQTTGQPYIGKPYELETLLGAVAAILQNRINDGSEAVI
jgi:CheY-like chemotaxis protein